jgi:peptide chain release factor subunit 1
MLKVETVEQILRLHGNGLPVLSLYARFDPANRRAFPSRVEEQLHEVRMLSKDPGLSRDARLSLRGDVARIEEAITEDRLHPQAIAFFSCSRRGVFEEVELPRPVRDRNVVDESAWVRPLVAVLDEYHRCRVVVVDRGLARFFELYQDEMAELSAPQSARKLRKPDYAAGMREHATHNKAEQMAKRHYRAVAERLDVEARQHRFDILAVGGHEHEVPDFLALLPRTVCDRVAGTFAAHPHETDLGTIRDRAGEIVQRYERAEEERLVADTLEVWVAGGLAASGLRDCLWGATAAAIEQLLVQDGVVRPGLVCDEDGYLAADGELCPLCGRALRRTPDILDELVQAVIDDGGGVEHVAADTPLRDHITTASLRFQLPPNPAG